MIRGMRGYSASALMARASCIRSAKRGGDNLWLQPLDGGPGRELTNFTSLRIYSYQWSPDGKSLALVRGDTPSDLVLIQESQKK
jgi:hypothetical protein